MKPEDIIQTGLIEWWSYAFRGFGLKDSRVLFHVPNGAYFGAGVKTLSSGKTVSLGAIRANNMKRKGLVNGVPDLLLIVPRGTFHGMALELKAKDGRPSIDQGQMLAIFESCGWQRMIAWSLDEGIAAITNYLSRGDALKSR